MDEELEELRSPPPVVDDDKDVGFEEKENTARPAAAAGGKEPAAAVGQTGDEAVSANNAEDVAMEEEGNKSVKIVDDNNDLPRKPLTTLAELRHFVSSSNLRKVLAKLRTIDEKNELWKEVRAVSEKTFEKGHTHLSRNAEMAVADTTVLLVGEDEAESKKILAVMQDVVKLFTEYALTCMGTTASKAAAEAKNEEQNENDLDNMETDDNVFKKEEEQEPSSLIPQMRKKENKPSAAQNEAEIPPQLMHMLNVLQSCLDPRHPLGKTGKQQLAAGFERVVKMNHRVAFIVHGTLAVYLCEEAIADRATQKSVEQLWGVRAMFQEFDWDDPSTKHMKDCITRCFASPPFFKNAHGQKFLAFILAQHHSLTKEVTPILQNVLPSQNSGVIRQLGKILFNAWDLSRSSWEGPEGSGDPAKYERRRLGKEKTRMMLEDRVSDWIHCAILAQPEGAKKALLLLNEFHMQMHAMPDLKSMLIRQYAPVLWKYLAAANPKVRLNAVTVLGKVFPLVHTDNYDTAHDDTRQEFKRQVLVIQDGIMDPNDEVRIRGIQCAAEVLTEFWTLIEFTDRQAMLASLGQVATDKRFPKVRDQACRALSHLIEKLPAGPGGHDDLKNLLICGNLWHLLHDKSPMVRSSFADFLEKANHYSTFQLAEVIDPQQMMARVAHEYAEFYGAIADETEEDAQKANAAVGRKLANIMRPAIFQDLKEQNPPAGAAAGKKKRKKKDNVLDLHEDGDLLGGDNNEAAEQRKERFRAGAERLDTLLKKLPLAVLGILRFAKEMDTLLLMQFVCYVWSELCSKPREVSSYKIAAVGIMLQRQKLGASNRSNRVEFMREWFTDESILQLLTDRADLTEYILDALKHLPSLDKGPVREKFVKNLKSKPYMVDAAHAWKMVGHMADQMCKDFDKVAKYYQKLAGGSADVADPGLTTKNIHMYNLMVKNPVCRGELVEKREAIIEKSTLFVQAVADLLRTQQPLETKKGPQHLRVKDVVALLRTAFRVALRCDWKSSFQGCRSPAPILAHALLDWARPKTTAKKESEAGDVNMVSNGEEAAPPVVDGGFVLPPDLENPQDMMQICRLVIENLGLTHTFYPQADSTLPALAVQLGKLLWHLSLHGTDLADNDLGNDAWRFLARSSLKIFRPGAQGAADALRDLLGKVTDDLVTDEDLKSLWASVLMKFQFVRPFHQFLELAVDPSCAEEQFFETMHTDPTDIQNEPASSAGADGVILTEAKVLTAEAARENPDGLKRFQWHPRVTDALYSQAARFKGLRRVLYFVVQEADGTLRRGPAAAAGKKPNNLKLNDEEVDKEMETFFDGPAELKDEDLLPEGTTSNADNTTSNKEALSSAPGGFSGFLQEDDAMDVDDADADESRGPDGVGTALFKQLETMQMEPPAPGGAAPAGEPVRDEDVAMEVEAESSNADEPALPPADVDAQEPSASSSAANKSSGGEDGAARAGGTTSDDAVAAGELDEVGGCSTEGAAAVGSAQQGGSSSSSSPSGGRGNIKAGTKKVLGPDDEEGVKKEIKTSSTPVHDPPTPRIEQDGVDVGAAGAVHGDAADVLQGEEPPGTTGAASKKTNKSAAKTKKAKSAVSGTDGGGGVEKAKKKTSVKKKK
ncbi:unnamed protein product [Amoebophrya sp. A120]|nr:unnamed protein product [Amoebophrya sp. A120]|eukprot:GSA120T00010956001.1